MNTDTNNFTGDRRLKNICLCIGIIRHSWLTRDSLVYYIRHFDGKYDCIHYVFLFKNITRVGFSSLVAHTIMQKMRYCVI